MRGPSRSQPCGGQIVGRVIPGAVLLRGMHADLRIGEPVEDAAERFAVHFDFKGIGIEICEDLALPEMPRRRGMPLEDGVDEQRRHALAAVHLLRLKEAGIDDPTEYLS